ncbi:MAG TPA: hypothetical protein VK442_00640 [Xanthobacteraceae bacterium]|nr:hypothetical protein [Xanthobacteraceae bacterium]
MLGLELEIGTSALRLWVAAGSAALLLVICVLALLRRQSANRPGPVSRSGVVILSAVLGAAIAWAFLDHAAVAERSAERRAFELRAQELSANALAPGSPLACLDVVVGESVAAACERALFASPASVAAASSYVAARLALLADIVGYAEHGGTDIDDVLLPLRRSLEADSFGFLAHVLSLRDGCASHNCKALALLHDASQVRANLSAQSFDHYLEHYLALWAKAADGAPADAAPAQTAAIPQGPRKVGVNADFPTAASIPAISIMNPEPTGPVLPGVAAAAAANPNPQPGAASPPRRSRKQAASPSPQTAAPPSAAAVEPVWPEPVHPPPQTAASGGAGPIELNPVPPPSNAGVGTTTRPQ